MKIELGKKILSSNDEWAMQNSRFFADNKTICLNMISSPGSGKTTILARTGRELAGKIKIGVIEGDIKTDTDAKKIRAAGVAAVQIETEGACHLNAQQVNSAIKELGAGGFDIVFVENVGNLVCPSAFDLGEHGRVVVLSVPEGDDKPTKYPGTFAKADVLLINKMDLIDHIDFDIERVVSDANVLKHGLKIFKISATTGEGMEEWYDWLIEHK